MKFTQRLGLAGKHLMHGNIGLAAKSMVVDVVNSASFRGQGVNDGGMWFFGNNGIDLHFNYNGHSSAIEAYTKCPPVTSIINKKAQAFINGIAMIENTQGSTANSSDAKKLRALLKNPNPLQTWKQFEAQSYIYKQLFGFTILLPIKPFGFPNLDATALWNIPPFMVDVKETKELFYNNPKGIISQIILTYKGVKTPIDIENIAIIEDFTPSFDSLVIPDSRIKSLQMPINNIIGAYESRNVLINRRGALGILSPEADQMGPINLNQEDKEALQQDFSKYGLKRQQWQVIITNAALKWQQMGYPTKDLMLFEEIEDSAMKICDQYGYPYRLLSQEKSASYNDVKEFKKMLYQDTIIPEANSFYEQLNQFFKLEDYNLIIKKNYSHVAVMQEDKKIQAETQKINDELWSARFKDNLITLNDYMANIGLARIPNGDIYARDSKDIPLAVKIGVGGVQALESILSSQFITNDMKKNILIIVFGLSIDEASQIMSGNTQINQSNQTLVS